MNEPIQRRVGYLPCTPAVHAQIMEALYGPKNELDKAWKSERIRELLNWGHRYHRTNFGSDSAKLRVIPSGGDAKCH